MPEPALNDNCTASGCAALVDIRCSNAHSGDFFHVVVEPPPLSALALQLQLWSADERAQSPALRRPAPGSVAEGKVRGGQPVGVWPGEKVRGGVGAWPRLAQVA